jgi:copper chaperone NosL
MPKTRKAIGSLIAFGFLFLSPLSAAEETSCFYCGMTKSSHGHSWSVVHYYDGSSGEFCSLHCASINIVLHTEKTAETILVGDYDTQKLIDADKAHWVIGGSKMGVMTTRAKWDFETKNAADRFMRDFGGVPATVEIVMKAAFEDMYLDIMRIQKNRKMIRMRKMEANK